MDMKMNTNSSEIAIKKLLKYLQIEVENTGLPVKNVVFNFSHKYMRHYFNHPSEEISEGEDLSNFRQQSQLDDQSIDSAIKAAIVRGYVISVHRTNFEEDNFISLTNEGLFVSAHSEIEILDLSKGKNVVFSLDYRTVDMVVDGKKVSETFSVPQAKAIQFLENEHKRGVSKVHYKKILEESGSEAIRMRDLFKVNQGGRTAHSLFGVLIKSERKGFWKLNI